MSVLCFCVVLLHYVLLCAVVINVLCIAEVCQLHSLRKVVIEEKEPQPAARTRSLLSYTELQTCEPPI